MNALTRATTTLPRVAGQRFYSRNVINNIENKNIWLSDPSTYPVIAVCTGACIGAISFINYTLWFHPDVRIDSNKRGSIMRWWVEKKVA